MAKVVKKPKKIKKTDRMPKYWICGDCADKKGWKLVPWPVTCTAGLCGWCDREDDTTVIPICDFTGPKGKKATWD